MFTYRFDGPEPGEIWGLSPEEEVLVRPPSAWMTFSDFVRLLKAEGIAETFYLEYLAIHQYLGELLEVMLRYGANGSGRKGGYGNPVMRMWLSVCV